MQLFLANSSNSTLFFFRQLHNYSASNVNYVVSINKEEFSLFINKFLKIKKGSVISVLNSLTLDNRFYSTILYRPLFEMKGRLYYSSVLFRSLHPSPILLNYLSKDTRLYDKLSTLIERRKIEEISTLLKENVKGDVYVEREIKYPDGVIKPDFIIVDVKKESIIIIDFKNFNPALSSKDILNRNSETEKGLRQIRNYIEILSSSEVDLFETKNYNFHGVMLFDAPIQVNFSTKDDNGTYIVDLLTMKKILVDSNCVDHIIKEIVKVLKIADAKYDFKESEVTLSVDDWRITRPVMEF